MEAFEDPATMRLTPAEIARARLIKAAVEADPGLHNLTDFDYVQYALTNTGETIDQVKARALHLQNFRDEYHLRDTVEEGADYYRESTMLFPGFALALEYLPSSDNFAAINDFAEFYPSRINTEHQARVFMVSMYYKFHAMNVNFTAIRSGITVVTECEGVSFDNFDPSVSERLMVEIFTAYPKRHKELMWLNTPTAINMLYGVVKRFFSQEMIDTFKLGCATLPGLEGYRLDALYVQPTPEIAREKMCQNVEKFLQARVHNQENFRLPPIDNADDGSAEADEPDPGGNGDA